MSKLERGFEGEGIEKVELRSAREPSTPWEWLRWAFDVEISNSAEKFVLVALAQHADRSGKCYPSVARLSAMTAQSRRSVQNKLAALAARGLISQEERLGTSTLYTLNSRALEDEPADVPNAECSADGKISRSGEVGRRSVEEHVPAHEVHPPCASPSPLPAHGLRTPRARRAPKHPITPKTTPIDRDAAVAAGDLDLLELQSEFLRAFPKGGSKASVKNGLVNALKEGATKESLLSAARSYAS